MQGEYWEYASGPSLRLEFKSRPTINTARKLYLFVPEQNFVLEYGVYCIFHTLQDAYYLNPHYASLVSDRSIAHP